MQNEPSMEEILSSIKRIIAEEDGLSATPRAPRRPVAPAPTGAGDDQILELTDALPGGSGDEADGAVPSEEPIMSAPAKPADGTADKSEPKTGKTETPKSESKPAARPRPATSPGAEASAAATVPDVTLVSDDKARAARDSLVNLSRLLISPEDSQPNTLEGLVREMLRPMLKEWLDENLPSMVESMVKREIDRITGRV